MQLKESVIAITGAGQGLGAAIADELSQAGANLILIDVNSKTTEETAAHCREQGIRTEVFCCDITSEEQVNTVFRRAGERFERLDGLVNNAGILRDGLLVRVRDGELTRMPLEQFQSVINVNLTGTFLCGREAAATMIEAGSKGVIINISSVARAGNIGQSNYAASKAAVATLATCWARELARYGIRAAAIAPGVIHTAMADQMKPEAIERLRSMIPVGRMGDGSDVARATRFIFENDYFTGRVLEVDGGLRM